MPRPMLPSTFAHPLVGGAAPQTDPTPPPTAEAIAAADYIVDMSEQLANLAQRTGLDLLSYLLSMARLEAELVKKRLSPTHDTTFE